MGRNRVVGAVGERGAGRMGSPLVVPLLAVWGCRVPGAVHRTYSQERGGEAGRPLDLEMGAGMDTLLRRPIRDDWVLSHLETYKRGAIPLFDEVRRALAQAVQLPHEADAEVAVDMDEDGVPDYWVYFADGSPAFVESDRYRTGCRDFRVDLRTEGGRTNEHRGWFLQPPIPVSFPRLPKLAVSDFFDRAYPDSRPGLRPSYLSGLAARLFPDLGAELGELAQKSAGAGEHEELEQHVSRAESLLPRFTREFQAEGLASQLTTAQGWMIQFRPYDLDDREGSEVAVGYAPRGVARIRFFEKDWQGPGGEMAESLVEAMEPGGLVADCFLEGGSVVQVHFRRQRYLRVAGHWVRLDPGVRRKIAEQLFAPAYRRYRAGQWYQAVAAWQAANDWAILTGDYGQDRDGRPKAELDRASQALWGFSVDGLPAASLVRLANNMVSRNRDLQPLEALADAAASGRDFDEALDLYRLVVRLARKVGKPLTEVRVLEQMSRIHARLGHYDLALELLLQSLDVESGLSYAQAVVQNVRKLAFRSEDPWLLRSTVKKRSHAMAVNRGCKLALLGSLYDDLGEAERAVGYLGEADRIFRNLGHQYGQADVLNLRARRELAENRPDAALRYLQWALQRLQEPPVALDQPDSVIPAEPDARPTHSFTVNVDLERYDVTYMTSGSPALAYQALTAALIGQAYRKQAALADPGRRPELLDLAERWLSKAQGWYRQAKDADGEIVTQLGLAMVVLDRGDLPRAYALAVGAREAAEARLLFEVAWQARLLEGAALAAQGRSDEALESYLAAARLIESVRSAIYSESVRRGFFASKTAVYQKLALMYAAREAEEKVWETMERAKARTLLDMVAGQPIPVRGPDVVRLSREEPVLFHTLLGGGQGATGDRREFERQLEAAVARASRDPLAQELVSLRTVQPVKLADLQAVLTPGELVLEYFVTDSELLVASISDRDLRIVQIPGYGYDRLRQEVDSFCRRIRDVKGIYQTGARGLYDALVAPCLAGYQNVRHLIIVPGGALHYLPFAALLDEKDRFLIQRWPVSYASSASALVFAHYKGDPGKGTRSLAGALVVGQSGAFGNLPSLPNAGEEAKQIHQRLPDPKALLINATETDLKRHLPDAQIFHFAGHADLLPSTPMRSALLAEEDPDSDGRLEVRELFGLRLDACRLAVLSACQTRMGRWRRGDELVGLTRAFLRAGVPTVVASLWKVDDQPTRHLMIRFYENLVRRGMSASEALREAQLSLLGRKPVAAGPERGPSRTQPDRPAVASSGAGGSPTRAHPRFWAAWVLIGHPDPLAGGRE